MRKRSVELVTSWAVVVVFCAASGGPTELDATLVNHRNADCVNHGGVSCAAVVIKVPGELWLLYSVLIQENGRTIFDIRTSSMAPVK